jgi:sugar lactone lactonase YvrE
MHYVVDTSWPVAAIDPPLIDVVAMEVDADDNLHAFTRNAEPVVVLSRRGEVIDRWGGGIFTEPHGMHMEPNGEIYLIDYGDHTIRHFSNDRKLLRMIGTPGVKSDTGATGRDWRTIERAAGPFNAPTDLAVGPDGDLYVSDGYANARVHRFSANGALKTSWGVPGSALGEFNLPHNIEFGADGLLHVSDRENNRIQRFTLEGQPVSELGGVFRPNAARILPDGHTVVAELGYHTEIALRHPAPAGRPHSRITIHDPGGQLVLSLGGPNHAEAGSFCAAHSLAVDSTGALYVGDVGWSANPTKPPAGIRAIQKFIREA